MWTNCLSFCPQAVAKMSQKPPGPPQRRAMIGTAQISTGLNGVLRHLFHGGLFGGPHPRKLVRELCQAGGQSGGGTDDPHHEMEA